MIAPWQVWLTDFGVPVGNEQGELRPSVVVGSEFHCAFRTELAIVVPLTTRDRGLRHQVPITSAESGLRGPSWACTEKIRTVSTKRFRRDAPLGRLTEPEIELMRRWVHRMIT